MTAIIRYIELIRDRVMDWDTYPFSIPAVARLGRLDVDAGVTVLVGENGSGKSTLIEAIAIAAGFNREGGTKNFTSQLRPSESDLHHHLRLTRGARREKTGFFLRAETMFNVSTEAEAYRGYGWEVLHEMSHGEAFLWVVENRFRNGGLFILDEPESALSPQRQLALLARIHELVQKGGQVIMATHSPILMGYPGARLYGLGQHGIEPVNYEDTEHVVVTRAFLSHPERMIAQLFRDQAGDE